MTLHQFLHQFPHSFVYTAWYFFFSLSWQFVPYKSFFIFFPAPLFSSFHLHILTLILWSVLQLLFFQSHAHPFLTSMFNLYLEYISHLFLFQLFSNHIMPFSKICLCSSWVWKMKNMVFLQWYDIHTRTRIANGHLIALDQHLMLVVDIHNGAYPVVTCISQNTGHMSVYLMPHCNQTLICAIFLNVKQEARCIIMTMFRNKWNLCHRQN